ncbi:MAG TPA: glycerol-3-phosphate dehydrogenase/oxidase [Candidatus Baltobacteraceae bacterium]|nr:glycerol-3-phosphate dehydrogenase/oxidase [Candidatus Baltobacteraceae bacterium]
MNRDTMLQRLANETFDVLIVGGGATGLGCAVDAASRGYRTALVEAADFAAGTSSRSTKLIHGGVRYLAQGNVHLVREALRERALLYRNAPYLVRPLAFLTPAYRWHEIPYYLAGLKFYDLLAGARDDFGRSRFVSQRETLHRLPWLRARDLHGAIEYHDGQFDDARLAIALARTAADHGAALANYTACIALSDATEPFRIVTVRDVETSAQFAIRARVVVNACGVFADALRRLDDPQAAPLLSLSRGTHLVFAAGVLSSRDALLIPKTDDRRVIFAIPWHGRTLVGTTDVPERDPVADPAPTDDEIAYLLATISAYTQTSVGGDGVSASFAGLRPLLDRRAAATTAALSREHFVEVSANGLVTIAGGKWTTYRKMAQDAVDAAARRAALSPSPCVTHALALHDDTRDELQALVSERPELGEPLYDGFAYIKADVVNGFRREMARTIDDILARRTRLSFLDDRAAQGCRAIVSSYAAAERASAD